MFLELDTSLLHEVSLIWSHLPLSKMAKVIALPHSKPLCGFLRQVTLLQAVEGFSNVSI